MLVENNIRLLKKINYPLQLITDNNQLQEMDDNYDGLTSLNSLSYSIYYTFQESFQEMKHSWDTEFSKERLNDLDIILDKLYSLIDMKVNIESGEEEPNIDYDDNKIKSLGNEEFTALLDSLCVRFDEYDDIVHQKSCQNILFKSFTHLCKLLGKSKHYLYKHDLFLMDFGLPKMDHSGNDAGDDAGNDAGDDSGDDSGNDAGDDSGDDSGNDADVDEKQSLKLD